MKQIRLAIIVLVFVEMVGCSPSKTTPAETPFSTLTVLPTSTSVPTNTPEKFTDVYIGFPDGMLIEYGGDITIASSDNVSMRNLRIGICPMQIGNNWQNVIHGINSFTVQGQISSLELSKENTYETTCESIANSKKSNFTTFRLETLSAKQFIDINIKVDPTIKLIERTYEGIMYIKTPTNFIGEPGSATLESAIFGRFADSAIYLIQRQWGIADFKIRVECDNCNEKEETFNLSFRENINIAGCKVLTKDENYITESCLFWFLFTVPENSSDILPKTEDHYFLATQNDSKYNSLVEISKEQFFGNVP